MEKKDLRGAWIDLKSADHLLSQYSEKKHQTLESLTQDPLVRLKESNQRSRKDLESTYHLLSKYADQKHQLLARVPLVRLKESIQRTLWSLESDDPESRIVAVLLLKDFWAVDVETEKICTKLAFSDPTAKVRGVSLYTLRRISSVLDDDLQEFLDTLFSNARWSSGDQRTEGEKGSIAAMDMIMAVHDEQIKDWRLTAGEEGQRILRERRFAIEYLRSGSARLRKAAIEAFGWYWGPDSELLEICRRITQKDDNEGVRRSGLRALGQWYRGSRDIWVARLMAEVVRNPGMSNDTRIAAYFGLREVTGKPCPRTLFKKIAERGFFKLETDIDWRFVDQW